MMGTPPDIRIEGEVERVNGKELSYTGFVKRYLSKNEPVVLSGLMDDWRASQDWVTRDGRPNLQFFATHFGNSTVQVADCGTKEFTDQKRVEMTVSEFVENWVGQEECSGKPLLYLKDWHFVKEYPDYVAYRTPVLFCDDWLNLYLDHHSMHMHPGNHQEKNEISCSDYRFVYMGAKGTWTPLHADVFRSYSWSANVCGRKRWLFLSPPQRHLISDRNSRTCVYNIFEDVDEINFPGFKKAVWLDCIQEQNEIIFVPSGWYHQVLNLEDTISINHNWFNGYNLHWVWDLLWRDYKEAKEYIEDIRELCDDFEGICQRNLAANTGMNFTDFFIFLLRFFLINLLQLYCHHSNDKYSDQGSCQLTKHLEFNLASIRVIALKMASAEGVTGDCYFSLDVQELLDDPKFLSLCWDLGITYGMIHSQQNQSHDVKIALLDDILDCRFEICSCDTFIEFMHQAVVKLGEVCCREIDSPRN